MPGSTVVSRSPGIRRGRNGQEDGQQPKAEHERAESEGRAFRGERVGLTETQEDSSYGVWWYNTKVGGWGDLEKKSITMGKGC